jgi:hypothetical protein
MVWFGRAAPAEVVCPRPGLSIARAIGWPWSSPTCRWLGAPASPGAAITGPEVGIGVDRLVIAATHTHAGPGHFFEGALYNEQGSSVVGFDELMLDSLSRRVARAVRMAVDSLRPARAAWGSRSVWGVTRIRSLPAMLRNIPPPVAPADAPLSLLPEYRLVDRDGSCGWTCGIPLPVVSPIGAFCVFAMQHGNSPSTTCWMAISGHRRAYVNGT